MKYGLILLLCLTCACANISSFQTGRVPEKGRKLIQGQISGAVLPDVSFIVPYTYSVGLQEGLGDGQAIRYGIQNTSLFATLGGYVGYTSQVVGDRDSLFALAFDAEANATFIYVPTEGAYVLTNTFKAGVPLSVKPGGNVIVYTEPSLKTLNALFYGTDASTIFNGNGGGGAVFGLSQALGMRLGPQKWGVLIEGNYSVPFGALTYSDGFELQGIDDLDLNQLGIATIGFGFDAKF